MRHKPLLSICITSYNRINELYRCLDSIDTQYNDSIEIVISEDCSPKKNEITQIVEKFISETQYTVIYNSNIANLGFDRNFAKLLGIARGKFILFSTDDDMFIKGSLDKVIDHLNVSDAAISFTPYMDKKTGIVERKFPKSFILNKGIKSVKNYLYCSILLSGLIFQNDKIVNYSSERFKDLIYSQVYLFATLLLKNDGLYIDIPLVHCVGDGENAFGLNESSEKNVLLSDRKSSLSNLEYHKALIEVIKIFDSENATDLLNSFSKEYSLRSFTGMYIARKNSRDELKAYWIMMKSLNIKTYATSHIYYWLLSILGCKVCDLIFYVPKAGLLKARQLKSRL